MTQSCFLKNEVTQVPIKRENKSRYSSDWAVISNWIRLERAGGRCEFPGCAAVHGQPHPLTGATATLTVAHLGPYAGKVRR